MLTSALISPTAGSTAATVGTPPTAQRSAGDGSPAPESFAMALNQASSPPPPAAAPPAAPARDETRSDAATAEAAPASPADNAAAARAMLQRRAVAVASQAVDDKSAHVGLPAGASAESVTGPSSVPALEPARGDRADDVKDATPDGAGAVAALMASPAATTDRVQGKAAAGGAVPVGATPAPGPSRAGAAPATDAAAGAPAAPARRGESGAEALGAAGERDAASRPAAVAASAAPIATTALPAAVTPLQAPTPGLSPAMAGANAPPLAEGRLPASPGSAEFAPALGAQLNVFLRDGVQHARLQLHPAELGPLTVQIQLDGTTAQVRLAAEHPLTRQALEQAMPLLAGTLRESGLTLTGGGVFEQPANPQAQQDGRTPAEERSAAGRDGRDGRDTPAQAAAAAARPVMARRGVVDLVA